MKTILLATLGLTLPLLASANRYNNINYAPVVEVEPIYQVVSVPAERQVCERAPRQRKHDRNRVGKTILGGVIGGAIGNKFGRGSGRDASTALGILIGAGVGSSKSSHRAPRSSCYYDTYYHEEERFMGYDVTYRYNGEIYHTQMNEHPGDRIKVRVQHQVID